LPRSGPKRLPYDHGRGLLPLWWMDTYRRRANRYGRLPMQHRPLTKEEYAIAGVPLDVCTNCKCQSLQTPYQWVYYRENGTPKVLCDTCFTDVCERGTMAGAAFLASPQAAVCEWPQDASSITGFPQLPPDAVNTVFDRFRDLSPDDVRELSLSIPIHAAPGHKLEWFGPISWWSVMRCLTWLRESLSVGLPFIFQRWEKLQSVIADNLRGDEYEPWRQRLRTFAHKEFLFRYSELLSDAVSKAHQKTAGIKTIEKRQALLSEIRASVCKRMPPQSLNGAAEELQRFVEYMDAQIAGCEK
jgi:hypothetical protein